MMTYAPETKVSEILGLYPAPAGQTAVYVVKFGEDATGFIVRGPEFAELTALLVAKIEEIHQDLAGVTDEPAAGTC